MDKKVLNLKQALESMLVATDTSVKLPKGHPGHEAYLNMVARPRAITALLEFEEIPPPKTDSKDNLKLPPSCYSCGLYIICSRDTKLGDNNCKVARGLLRADT